jgi:hypothetical protein
MAKNDTSLTRLQEEVRDIIKLHTTGKSDQDRWMQELARHGCASGLVNNLIHYQQTERFFHEHEDEILELAARYEFRPDVVELGMLQFKNTMAWFAFEVTAEDLMENNSLPL